MAEASGCSHVPSPSVSPLFLRTCMSLCSGKKRVSFSTYLGVTPGCFLSLIHPCRDPSTFVVCTACVRNKRTWCDLFVRWIKIIGYGPYPTRRVLLCRSSATDWVVFHEERASRACVDHGIDCNAHMPAGKRPRMWIVMGPIPSWTLKTTVTQCTGYFLKYRLSC